MEHFDVVVVGAGPAGSAAAAAAAQRGVSVLLLDKAEHPRYKTCGGGLIGPTLGTVAGLAAGEPPTRAAVHSVSFTLRGQAARLRQSGTPVFRTAARSEFDAWLAKAAEDAGATAHLGRSVTGVEEHDTHVEVRTDRGAIRAGTVVGADGTSSKLARLVGVHLAHVDLGLELELAAEGPAAERWRDRVHLDWGPLPGSYGWVFPKGDGLTVGVIAAKGAPVDTRRYLELLVEAQGLSGLRVLHDSGHLTRCRAGDSPLGRGRILLAGDAAGLLEPWTREGISFAVRSGAAAGRLAVAHLASETTVRQIAYRHTLEADLLAEMAAGERCRRAFERRPGAFHHLIARTDVGWGQFCRLARGETNLARAWQRLPVRAGVGALGGVRADGFRGAR
ncbi:geranylgeranyl reductase family protein [Nocardioides acrostichi]|uniref:Geranylgeranyl reductase family protein n=1 Tax=Nocardioides acrostichi TaxID=2784339 RepID=A0A930UYM3_9ACTN|nr:geranylgeranyl reductase family protein [Nocardioides acrostichi]MBF4162506.1 geranylgeranyl reductase family protein [Nocardioides acrostichi]